MTKGRAERPTQYDTVSKVAHWLSFALVAAAYAVGWTMPHVKPGTKPETLINLHLSLGASLLAVVAFRVLWRIVRPAPGPAPGVTRWEAQVAKVTHLTLYALIFIMPLTGWAATSVRSWSVKLFGFVPLPGLLPPGTKLGFELGDLHADILTWVLLALIGLHLLGALYHRLVRRDQVLQRMLPLP